MFFHSKGYQQWSAHLCQWPSDRQQEDISLLAQGVVSYWLIMIGRLKLQEFSGQWSSSYREWRGHVWCLWRRHCIRHLLFWGAHRLWIHKVQVKQGAKIAENNHLLVSHIHREARMTTVDYLSQVSDIKYYKNEITWKYIQYLSDGWTHGAVHGVQHHLFHWDPLLDHI